LNELDDSEDRPRHDECTDDVQSNHVSVPWHLQRSIRGTLVHAGVEQPRGKDEDAEEDDLDEETTDDDIGAGVSAFRVFARQ
jgi:hypothetical protein